MCSGHQRGKLIHCLQAGQSREPDSSSLAAAGCVSVPIPSSPTWSAMGTARLQHI